MFLSTKQTPTKKNNNKTNGPYARLIMGKHCPVNVHVAVATCAYSSPWSITIVAVCNVYAEAYACMQKRMRVCRSVCVYESIRLCIVALTLFFSTHRYLSRLTLLERLELDESRVFDVEVLSNFPALTALYTPKVFAYIIILLCQAFHVHEFVYESRVFDVSNFPACAHRAVHTKSSRSDVYFSYARA